MSLATDKKRWDDLHAAYAKAQEAASEYDRQLHAHYGRYEKSWLKAAQRKKLESLQDRVDKIGDKIVELIKKISPRDWMSGVPAYWIRSELTWEDAIRPKGEPLSVTPPTAWGHDRPIQEEGIVMASRKKRSGVGPANQAEVAGKRYAQEQLASDYFMEWVMEQLAEAADMDPSDTLPLATKEDALVIAGNMLQQLRWDTQRDLGPRELAQTIGGDPTRGDVEKFYAGFRETLDGAQDWLADELLRLKGEMRGGVREAPRNRPTPTGLLAGMSYEQILSLAHKHRAGSPEEREAIRQAQAYITQRGERVGEARTTRWPDWMILESIEKGHMMTPQAKDRAFELIDLGYIDATGTWKLTTKGQRALAQQTDRISDASLVAPRLREPRRMHAGRSTPVEDPEYVIQGLYNDGTIHESFGFDDEATARSEAWKLSRSAYFEGDYVRIITRDGELVWDSRGKGGTREPRHRAAERMYHVIAINERTGKKTYLTRTPVTHQEALTVLRKQRPHKDVRKQLEPA